MKSNIKEISPAKKESGLRHLVSTMMSRMNLAVQAGLRFDGKRDLYQVFGYKPKLTPDDLLGKYIRQDIASRIVDAPPGATWSRPPTPEGDAGMVAKWEELLKNRQLNLLGAMYRADRLARLNPFSLLLLGFSGSSRSKVSSADNLLYARAIGSRQVTNMTFNTNTASERYGLPETYKISFDDPSEKSGNGTHVTSAKLKDMTVHWTRVVHVVENPLEDLVHGTPIVERVFNLLDDLLKVSGGTSETYWLTSNRGMQADIDKEMDIDPDDAAALSDEIEEYQHEQRRFIRTRGVDLKVLQSSTPNPKETFSMIIALISGTTGIPRRILLGSEAGQLASEQDRANWAERIEERRVLSTEPGILYPTVNRLQGVGIMPEGDVIWKWPSAFIQNPLEEGQTMAQFARAIGNISRQTGSKNPMPLVSTEEGRGILGFEGELNLAEVQVFIPPPEETLEDDDMSQEDKDEKREDEKADEPDDKKE